LKSLTAGQRRIFAVTWITYAGFYFCRKNLSIVLPMLHGVSGLESIELAHIIFGYSLMYSIGQFGFGFLSDSIGPKRVVGAGLLLIAASNLLMSFRASLVWLLIFSCLNGIGQATGWSGLVKTMASWFSPENRGVIMAWWGTNYVLGGFLATAFATWSVAQHVLLPELGWRRGFLFPALLLLVITAAFFAWDKDAPEQDAPQKNALRRDVPEDGSRWTDLAALLRDPSLWLIGASYFFLELCRYALMFWLPFYMVSRLRYSLQASGYLASLYELVGIGGAILAGYLSDHFMQSRRAPVSAIMLCGLGLVMLLQPSLAATGLMGTALAISLAGILSYGPDTLLSGAGAQDVGAGRGAGTAAGLIDGLGHLGSLLSPYIVVYVSKQYGWDRLFEILAVSAFVAGAVLLPIWNLKPADYLRARELSDAAKPGILL
jgi:sugar phosphate permease